MKNSNVKSDFWFSIQTERMQMKWNEENGVKKMESED